MIISRYRQAACEKWLPEEMGDLGCGRVGILKPVSGRDRVSREPPQHAGAETMKPKTNISETVRCHGFARQHGRPMRAGTVPGYTIGIDFADAQGSARFEGIGGWSMS